jgi:hypothetical protein
MLKKCFPAAVGAILILATTQAVQAQGAMQSEEDFEKLMPITGTVDTFFGEFELDHSFPAVGEAERIYDLMDHQRAAQLYLWGIPIVGLARWHQGYVEAYENYDYNTILYVNTFNERRGILTANETTDYFWGFGNTRDAAVIVEVPEGLAVGLLLDFWQQGFTDIGIFGPNAGAGGTHVIVGPGTPPEMVPEVADGQLVHHIDTHQMYFLARMLGTPEEVKQLSSQLKVYNYGDEPLSKIITGEDKFVANYQPRGLAYWELLHQAINQEVVQDRDRLFMYWLKTLGIEKGQPFAPTDRQKRVLEDGAKVGELMAKTLVFNERLEGVLRQNNWRMILGGEWGDGIKYTQRMKYYDTFDPRARYMYEAIVTSAAMTVPMPGKAQAYIGKFEDESGERLHGSENYVIRINGPVPAKLFWSMVIYDTDTRTLIDNREGAAGGKATVGSKTPDLRVNADGSYYVFLGPDGPPKGWEANHVQTVPGRGWFPYMRAYGAQKEFFNDKYKFPTVEKVEDFSEFTK